MTLETAGLAIIVTALVTVAIFYYIDKNKKAGAHH